MIRKPARTFLLIALSVSTVGCDRVTKHIAMTSLAGRNMQSMFGGAVSLQYAENTGGFLRIGAGLTPGWRTLIFVVGVALALVGVVIAAARTRWNDWDLLALGLALSGGASNLFDRLVGGAVVDFVSIGSGPVRTGIFNIADVAIMAGVLMLLSPVPRRTRPFTREDE